jgi:TorA maturation chaperone TorD
MPESDLRRIAARADLCRLLAACYYQPGPEFAEERVFDSMRTAGAEVDSDLAALAQALAKAFDAQPPEELQIDYTRLFLNPAGSIAAPYESAWIAGKDPMAFEAVMRSVLDSYHAGGYEVDEGFRDLPDHIAAELEFLYTLVFREARAAASGNDVERAEATDLRRRFVEQHLGRWIGPFAEALRGGGETAFYRVLADLTERFVRSEAG